MTAHAGSSRQVALNRDTVERWSVHRNSPGSVVAEIGGLFRKITSVSRMALHFFHPERAIPLSRDRLNNFSCGEQCASACRILAEYVHQYVAHTFLYPPHLSRDDPHWTAAISRDDQGDVSLWGAGVYLVLEHNEEKLRQAIEATMLNGMVGLVQRLRVRAADRDSIHFDPDFLLDVTTRVFSVTGDHLQRVNESRRQYGEVMDKHFMRADFGRDLHKGLSADPRLNVAEQRMFAIKNFFQSLSARLMGIAFPKDSASIEMPYGFRGNTYDLLREGVIPHVMHDITEMVTSRAMVNTALLKVIEALNSPCEVENAARELRKSSVGRDRRQKRLDKAAATVVRELVYLVAPTIGKIVAVAPGGYARIGSAIGSAVRRMTEEVNVLQLVNKGVELGLPTIQPGVWREVEGRQVFIPGTRDSHGCFKPIDKLSFCFLKNDFERRRAAEAEDVANEMLEKEVMRMLASTISQKIRSIGPAFVDLLLRPFREVRRLVYEGVLPPLAVKLLKGMERVLAILFISIVGNILYLVTYPITRLLGRVVDRYALGKAEDIIRRIHMDIHKNLVYSWWDCLIEALQLDQRVLQR